MGALPRITCSKPWADSVLNGAGDSAFLSRLSCHRSLQATGTRIASSFYVLVVSFFSSWVLVLPSASVQVRKYSNFLLTSLVATVFLFGCDANLRKQLFVHGELKDGASLQQRVEVSFNAFAMKEGFSCGIGNALPVLRSCRAAGPRFLELHRSQSSFTIFLDQPYPGGIMSKVPKNYVAASEELESVFKSEFGSVVVVVSK